MYRGYLTTGFRECVVQLPNIQLVSEERIVGFSGLITPSKLNHATSGGRVYPDTLDGRY